MSLYRIKSTSISRLKGCMKGFTLLEILISVALFGAISVVFSNILLSVLSFSYKSDMKSDILYEINGFTSFIRNKVRVADRVEVCSQLYNNADSKFLLFNRGAVTGIFFNAEGKLKFYSQNTMLQCNGVNLLNLSPTLDLNSSNLTVSNLRISRYTDGGSNSIVFISIEVCDPNVGGNARNIVFDCDRNPYKSLFAISTRKI